MVPVHALLYFPYLLILMGDIPRQIAERRIGESNARELASTAWAFATVGQPEEKLFVALARMAERRTWELKIQELTDTARAFPMARQADAQTRRAALADADQWMANGGLKFRYAIATQNLRTVLFFRFLQLLFPRWLRLNSLEENDGFLLLAAAALGS